jgi:enoyl-[acyl-carrier-protein] reductase (NADH)
VSGDNMDSILTRRAAAEGRTAKEIACGAHTDKSALRRRFTPEEMARATQVLASDLSSAVMGDPMRVDCRRF